MRILRNEMIGKYAAPTDHPPTCANNPPWLIYEMRIEVNPDVKPFKLTVPRKIPLANQDAVHKELKWMTKTETISPIWDINRISFHQKKSI